MDYKVHLGRFSPLHLGHQQIIDKILQTYGMEQIIIMIGSSNIINERTPFTYTFRKEIIHTIYPDIKIMPIPDFNDDPVWLNYIKSIESKLNSKFTFFGGSTEDLGLLSTKFKTKVLIDRFKKGREISGTKVRQGLKDNDLKYLKESLDPVTYNLLIKT